MFKTTTKSLILISLILTFALAQNGGGTALTAGTENTQVPAVNAKLQSFIQEHADEIKAEPDIDANYCLQQFTSTTFQSQYGELMGDLIEVGCIHGLELCDTNDLYGIEQQLQANGFDGATIKQIGILIGSMIGSSIGESACDGVSECEWIGGKIGAALTCLSVSKEIYQGISTAVSTLKNVANQVGNIGQDTANAITDAAKTAETGVQNAINQIEQGSENDAVNDLKGATNQVAQSFTDLGNSIVNGLNTAGGAIAGAADQAGGAIVGAADQAGGAIAGAADQAGGAIAGAADQAGGAIAGAAQDVGSKFCGFFGC